MTDHINRNPEAIARILGDELPPMPACIVNGLPKRSIYVVSQEDVRDYALAAIAPYKAEIESLRTMLNTYNLGGWTDSHAILKRAEKAEAEVERAFQMLEMNGVPRERARSVSNGIGVLATRLLRENGDLLAEVAKLRELLREADAVIEADDGIAQGEFQLKIRAELKEQP